MRSPFCLGINSLSTAKKIFLLLFFMSYALHGNCWGFFAHQRINYYAVFLLPPGMMVLYKPNIDFMRDHAVDPDKRRWASKAESPRHYLDFDSYGPSAKKILPATWKEAQLKFPSDTLNARGIVPWWIEIELNRLTAAFRNRSRSLILKLSADLGHYIGDSYVPLHASSNHNGQLTNQVGIHAFWESRIPELLADKEWNFFLGKAIYINQPSSFIWKGVYESAAAADTVLKTEKQLSEQAGSNQRYAFEERNGLLVRQYSSYYSLSYDKLLNGMVERRMQQAIFATASLWYTAWINAGQPNLAALVNEHFSPAELKEFEDLDLQWKKGNPPSRACD